MLNWRYELKSNESYTNRAIHRDQELNSVWGVFATDSVKRAFFESFFGILCLKPKNLPDAGSTFRTSIFKSTAQCSFGLTLIKSNEGYISKNYLTTKGPYHKRMFWKIKIRKLYSPDPDSGSGIPEIWEYFFLKCIIVNIFHVANFEIGLIFRPDFSTLPHSLASNFNRNLFRLANTIKMYLN